MSISITKMHGNGNDFIIIEGMVEVVIPPEMKPEFANVYCDREFGIGADGVLSLKKQDGEKAVRMQLFQPHGSEAAMCGNGIRCLEKSAFDKEHAKTDSFKVETKASILSVRSNYDGDYMVSIDMGKAVFGKDEIAIRTYERRVEGETQLSGTGTTAAALAASTRKLISSKTVHVTTVWGQLDLKVGGKIPVTTGPAETVFEGKIVF